MGTVTYCITASGFFFSDSPAAGARHSDNGFCLKNQFFNLLNGKDLAEMFSFGALLHFVSYGNRQPSLPGKKNLETPKRSKAIIDCRFKEIFNISFAL